MPGKEQFNLWPDWRKGSFVEGNKPIEPEKTEPEKTKERIDGIIQEIYRKIDESKARQIKKEEERAEDSSETLPAEKDVESKTNYRDYKSRQYKD